MEERAWLSSRLNASKLTLSEMATRATVEKLDPDGLDPRESGVIP